MGVIHAVKCQYRKHRKRKALAMIDGELLGDAVSPDLLGWRKQEEEEMEEEFIENKVSFFCCSRTRGSKKIYPAVQCGGWHANDVL
jgi:hypothetical protein